MDTASRSRRVFFARGLSETSCPSDRGRREYRALDAPAAWWAEKNSHTSVVTTVTPETPSIPRAMVLTVYFVLSPVIGLVCHRRQRILVCPSPVGPTCLR